VTWAWVLYLGLWGYISGKLQMPLLCTARYIIVSEYICDGHSIQKKIVCNNMNKSHAVVSLLLVRNDPSVRSIISHLLGLPEWFPSRLEPIMLWKPPIMLLSSAQKFNLLCSKLCSQNQDYAQDLTVLLECIRISWLLYQSEWLFY